MTLELALMLTQEPLANDSDDESLMLAVFDGDETALIISGFYDNGMQLMLAYVDVDGDGIIRTIKEILADNNDSVVIYKVDEEEGNLVEATFWVEISDALAYDNLVAFLLVLMSVV